MGAKPTIGRGNLSPDLSSLCLAITDQSPLPMAAVQGATRTVCHVNAAFCRLMAKPVGELVGKPFQQLLPKQDKCLALLNRVFRTGNPENYTEQEHFKAHPVFWSYTLWPVLADQRLEGVMIQVTETAEFHGRMVAMNEELMLRSMRQHEVAEAAVSSNAQLQKEIAHRKQAEAHRRIAVLAAANRKLELEIAQRRTVEKALKTSEQLQRRLLEESRHMRDQLRLLSRQLLLAQEEERKRISRELHDVIAQTLTGINLRLATLKMDASMNTENREQNITRTQQLVEQAVNVVHQFARELRPTVLDDIGLIPALHTFMKAFKEETGIQVSLSAFAAVEHLKGDKRIVFFRVAQEALTNVARHARASRVEVSIEKLGGAVCMRIKDNGKGLAAESAWHGQKNKRLGLLGMRERLEMVGGKFTIESVSGQGTTITAQVPLGKGHAGTEGAAAKARK
jgi:signal transduction histidine kinase